MAKRDGDKLQHACELKVVQRPSIEAATAGAPAAPIEAPRSNGWGLFSMAWAHFLNDGGANYLPGVLPAILVALNIRLALVGVVMSALLIGQALQPACGWIADRVGGRAFVIGGVTLSTVAGALAGIAPGYYSLLGVLLLVGLGSALFHPQALAAVREMATRRQGLYISTFLMGGELGRGLWPIAAAVVVDYLGLRSLLLLALPTIATLPLIAHELPRLLPGSSQPAVVRAHLNANLWPMATLVAYSSTRAVVMYSVVTFLPLLWKLEGGSLVGGAGLITTLLTVGVLGNLAGGHLADHFSRKSVVIGATALTAVFLASYLLTGGLTRWLILGGLGIMIFSTFPLQILIAQDLLPDNRALGSGLALGFSNGIGAAAMMPLGPLAAHWSIPAALWVNVGLTMLALALAFALPTTGPRAE
jgi:MFS transporter, FSR family, fosmidomycin resistance protein